MRCPEPAEGDITRDNIVLRLYVKGRQGCPPYPYNKSALLFGFVLDLHYLCGKNINEKFMEAATMKQPETVALIYDKANPVARKTLDFILSLGVFQIQKTSKNQVEIGLDEYRKGKYTVINKGKSAGIR